MGLAPVPSDAAIARVVLDSPLPQLDRLFEYLVPAPMRDRIGAGMRVRVPLRSGGRRVSGYVVGTAAEAEYSGALTEIDDLVSTARVLTPGQLSLARAVADRQAGTLSDVLRLMVPKRSVRLEEAWLADADGERRARAEAEPSTGAFTDRLQEAGRLHTWFGAEPVTRMLGPQARIALEAPTGMRGEVPAAMAALAELSAWRLDRGESVILAVPDFRDVDLLVEALGAWIPAERIRRLDARLTPKPRYEQYLRALEPVAQVIVGTRSVVYAPAHRLGALIMWDDGDESFAEPLAPYAHAREVAIMRAVDERAALFLAGHVPSLPATRLIEQRWLQPLAPARIRRPKVVLADAVLGDGPGRAARIPEAAWRALREGLDDGPVLVQVGRAGYRPALVCENCREPCRCTRCGGALAQARPDAPLACSVCGAIDRGWSCPVCGGTRLRASAIGHERTSEELGRAFPGVRLVIADAAHRLVQIDHRPQLVVATRGAEPAPDGGWRAVLLLDTERALARESLDTVQDSLRAWANAAALAADGAPVVVTGAASSPLLALRDWKFGALSAAELEQRRELDFPPAVRVGAIRGTSGELEPVLYRLRTATAHPVEVLGPIPEGGEGLQRAVIRFPYRAGQEVAALLKAELVRAAIASPRRGPGRGSRLRVHLDEPDLF